MSLEKQIDTKKDSDDVSTDKNKDENTNKNTKKSNKMEDKELLDSHDEQVDEMKKKAPAVPGNRNEKNLEKRKCYNCNNKGHIAVDCPNKNISKWCTYCSKKNHNTDECWSAKRNDRNIEDTKESEETEEVTCGICKKKGHCTKEHRYSQQNRRDQQRTAGRENNYQHDKDGKKKKDAEKCSICSKKGHTSDVCRLRNLNDKTNKDADDLKNDQELMSLWEMVKTWHQRKSQ